MRLTRVLSEPENEAARRDLDAAVVCLKENGSDDACEYADQIMTVLTVM